MREFEASTDSMLWRLCGAEVACVLYFDGEYISSASGRNRGVKVMVNAVHQVIDDLLRRMPHRRT